MGTVSNIFRHSNNPMAELTAKGWVYNFSAAAASTTVTGSTSFANTDPTFCLSVNGGLATPLCVIPLYMSLGQTGTVAGGAISVIMEVDNAARLSSGGTAMTLVNARTDGINAVTGLSFHSATGSAIVATNAYGNRIWGVTVGQDVSPAEGVSNELVWTPPAGAPEILVANATQGCSWLIYTLAASTGPTWFYSFKVAAFPLKEL